jgi:DNA-binding FadR family transcriptional regulator
MAQTNDIAETNKVDGSKLSDNSQRPGYEIIASKIVELVTANNLKPGDRLPTERALSEQLGVSRTVIREAVKVLVATGLVRTQQGSGLYVNKEPHLFSFSTINVSMSLDPQEVENLFEFRLTLEASTAHYAAERITPRELIALQEALMQNRRGAEENWLEEFHSGDAAFHIGIANATRNPFYLSAVSTIFRLHDWAVNKLIGGTPGSLSRAVDEHEAILKALQRGLPVEAEQTMREHIETTRRNYQEEVRRRLSVDVQEVRKR